MGGGFLHIQLGYQVAELLLLLFPDEDPAEDDDEEEATTLLDGPPLELLLPTACGWYRWNPAEAAWW